MICSKCGGEFGEGNFCSNCGAPKSEMNVSIVNTKPVVAPEPPVNSSNMKTCKSCGKLIAKNAKTCPNCGAKNKKHTVLIIIIAVIAFFIIVGAIGGNSDKEPKKVGDISTNTVDISTSKKQEKFKVGEIVEMNNVKATLVKVSESIGSQFNKPSAGNVFVLCEFEIVNNSDKDVTVSSMLNFEAYCDDYTTNLSINAELEREDGKNQLDGTVAPGKKFNGVIGYEVPSDWKELEIRFTPDWWNDRDIIFVANSK
ncbi:MAG: DUF5067 domain-containing protein [Clostridia bacterium]|nr:DUF5067 domain-containing protein [Clostridia bacterium]